MGQLRRGVTQILAVHHPLVVVIPRFIQLILLLLPLKPMEQSQCGVPQILEGFNDSKGTTR
jgi:hypothetical protein